MTPRPEMPAQLWYWFLGFWFHMGSTLAFGLAALAAILGYAWLSRRAAAIEASPAPPTYLQMVLKLLYFDFILAGALISLAGFFVIFYGIQTVGFQFAQFILRFALAGLCLVPILDTIDSAWLILGLLLLVCLAVFTLEWLVRARIAKNPESWALRFSAFSRVVQLVTLPFVALHIYLFGDSQGERESGVTETELISMVEAGQQEGVLESDEHKMIVSIFRLGDTLVRAIMVPRIDILALEVDTPLQQAVDAFIRSGHSRSSRGAGPPSIMIGPSLTATMPVSLRPGEASPSSCKGWWTPAQQASCSPATRLTMRTGT